MSMAYELIITEKPSAARKIAFALADDKPKKKSEKGVSYYFLRHNKKEITVACAVGHLYTIAEKKKSFRYPSFDIEWKQTAKVNKSAKYTKKYVNVLKKLSEGADDFTVACDYDIEGEVIGLNCVRFACSQKDASRMKFSTLTKPDLIESYENKKVHLDWGQAHAGEVRHKLDWMYGINISRALTLAIRKSKIYRTLSSGRVQGPALKIIVDKEKEIKKFVPKKYWQIELLGKTKSKKITAWHEIDKFWEEKKCLNVLKKIKGHDGKVKDINKRNYKQPPPNPFDLTSLQTEAYRQFRISPKQTLQIAQQLYINGLISYPRTSSQKLPKKIGYKQIMSKLSKIDKSYKKLADMLFEKKYLKPNEGKKTDPAHPAIYPTGYNDFKFNKRQKKIYDLIVKRFFATFGDWAVRQSMKIKIDVNSEIFLAKGKRTIEKGWHVLYEPYVKFKEEQLPEVDKGDIVNVDKFVKHNKETEPPRRYTPASIIKELEKRSLGTKSTRAQIIDSLYQRNYITGRSITATELGIKTTDVLEKYSPKIVKEELTRFFEEQMQKVRENKLKPDKIIKKAKIDLTEILNDFKKKEPEIGKELREAYKELRIIGKCEICKKGNLVVKSSRKTKQRFIACDAYPDCKTIYPIPQRGKIIPTDKKCEHCQFPLIDIIKKKKQTVCFNPNCDSKKINDKTLKKKIEKIQNGEKEKKCPKCKKGTLVLRKSVYGSFFGCSSYPKCKHTEKIMKKND
ncbi:DNA topoisomerase I [Candidatus Woesearchaeota archaeon]|nr:DNA topoisomerase I [Candidatus Woesearchaeota archaeon]